jgi:hypothetical protein
VGYFELARRITTAFVAVFASLNPVSQNEQGAVNVKRQSSTAGGGDDLMPLAVVYYN